MTDRRSLWISSRKQPKQARSTELVVAVLEAAVRYGEGAALHHDTYDRVGVRGVKEAGFG
jgi:hypothetical protein